MSNYYNYIRITTFFYRLSIFGFRLINQLFPAIAPG